MFNCSQQQAQRHPHHDTIMAIIQDPCLTFKGAGDFHPPGDEQQRDAALCAAGTETAHKDSNALAKSQTAGVNNSEGCGFVWVNSSQKLQEAAERLQKVRIFAQVEQGFPPVVRKAVAVGCSCSDIHEGGQFGCTHHYL